MPGRLLPPPTWLAGLHYLPSRYLRLAPCPVLPGCLIIAIFRPLASTRTGSSPSRLLLSISSSFAHFTSHSPSPPRKPTPFLPSRPKPTIRRRAPVRPHRSSPNFNLACCCHPLPTPPVNHSESCIQSPVTSLSPRAFPLSLSSLVYPRPPPEASPTKRSNSELPCSRCHAHTPTAPTAIATTSSHSVLSNRCCAHRTALTSDTPPQRKKKRTSSPLAPPPVVPIALYLFCLVRQS